MPGKRAEAEEKKGGRKSLMVSTTEYHSFGP